MADRSLLCSTTGLQRHDARVEGIHSRSGSCSLSEQIASPRRREGSESRREPRCEDGCLGCLVWIQVYCLTSTDLQCSHHFHALDFDGSIIACSEFGLLWAGWLIDQGWRLPWERGAADGCALHREGDRSSRLAGVGHPGRCCDTRLQLWRCTCLPEVVSTENWAGALEGRAAWKVKLHFCVLA